MNSNDIPFNLSKGEKFNLTKGSDGDTNFYIGLRWDEPKVANGVTFDCDASVFACAYNRQNNPKLVSRGHFVYFDQLTSSDGAIAHSGDDTTGGETSGDDDNEQIRFYLDRLHPDVEIMSIIVTIYKAIGKKQNFGQVRNAMIRVCKMDEDGIPTKELFRFNLTDDYSRFTAIQFGDIYRDENGEWQWHSQGVGFEKTEIGDIVKIYYDHQ